MARALSFGWSLFAISCVRGQVTPEEIAEIGKALYDAVKDNQPVIDVSLDWAGAVPKGDE